MHPQKKNQKKKHSSHHDHDEYDDSGIEQDELHHHQLHHQHHHHHHFTDENCPHDQMLHHDFHQGDDDEIDEKLSKIIENVTNIELVEPATTMPLIDESSAASATAVALKEVKFVDETSSVRKPQPPSNFFHLSKQHTGLKNRSFNVGAAVSPTDKMEFVQERPESFGLLKINRPIGGHLAAVQQHNKLLSPQMERDHHGGVSPGEGMTDQGYFDLKFFHNKLW